VIRFRHRDNHPDAARPAEAAVSDGAEEHRSPGLKAALAGHAARVGCRVLDLGPAVPANVAFVSAFASHLRIADLMDDGPEESESESSSEGDGTAADVGSPAAAGPAEATGSDEPDGTDPPSYRRDLAERLVDGEEPFDLVLVWDYLSRLDREQTDQLVGRLRRATRPGSALYLLVHEGSEMPAEPQVFEIREQDRIAYRPAGPESTPAPKIPPAEVARRLSGFRIDASFVLRHGVREYVAVRELCDEDHIS
jgi:uncharacterized Zn-binding protein involved in type VI secretion